MSPKSIFLETHNINNRASGLGTFNYELIKGLSTLDFNNYELILNSAKPELLKDEFKDKFKYHKYSSLSRHPLFRIRKNMIYGILLIKTLKLNLFTKLIICLLFMIFIL